MTLAITGQMGQYKNMADGSIRLNVELHCTLEEFAKIYQMGAGIAIARLETAPMIEEEKPAKEPNGPMCMDCIWLMNNPEFEDWFYEKHRMFLENNYKHGKKHEDVLRDAVCELLGVSSRKEIDGSVQATNAYQNMKHAFMGRNL